MAFTPNYWQDGAGGGTPIDAEQLNRIEAAGVAASAAPSWGSVTGKPATFPPAIGTTASTALAGNTALLAIGTTATTAKAGNYQPTIAQVSGLEARLAAIEARLDVLETPEA